MPYCELILKNKQKVQENKNFKWKEYKEDIFQFIFYLKSGEKIILPENKKYFYFKTASSGFGENQKIEKYSFGYINNNIKTTYIYDGNSLFVNENEL